MRRLLFAWIVMSIFTFVPMGFAKEHQKAESQGLPSLNELSPIIQDTLASENAQIQQIKEQIRTAGQIDIDLITELKAYSVQQTAYESLLLLTEAPIEDLKRALAGNRIALDRIAGRLNELASNRDQAIQALNDTREKLNRHEEELARLKSEQSKNPETRQLIKDIRLLITALYAKRELVKKVDRAYTSIIDKLTRKQDALAKLSQGLEDSIKSRKKKERLQRNVTPLTIGRWLHIGDEFLQMADRLRQVGSAQFWEKELNTLKGIGAFMVIILVGLLAGTLILLTRLRKAGDLLMRQPGLTQRPWLTLSLNVFFRSLTLFGFTLSLTIYASLWHFIGLSLVHTLLNILWVWVITQWGFSVLKAFDPKSGSFPSAVELPVNRLSVLVLIVRLFGTIYLVLHWLMPVGSTLNVAIRLIFLSGLLWWCLRFANRIKGSPVDLKGYKTMRFGLPAVLYSVVGGALLFELAGYANFAIYWCISWGRFAAIALWFGLFSGILREWRKFYYFRRDKKPQETASHHLVQWTFLQICMFLWIFGFCIALLFAWDAGHGIIQRIFGILNHSIKVGNMQFSLMSVIYAFIILFLTHLAARICRYIFRTRLLAHSGIEPGLQESITSISAYVLWSLGILMAFQAFGFTTATLAVALGALGIGLGFGLQNIFNNFVSGIILLFERPIQVGDDIEVGGIWATVKKINVRSTVVQTYDNASLIIPNSDLISNQVTNWSFKDRRLRRHIVVGVAYGSDVELVRNTLLEVAEETSSVLKSPKPDVIFADFGDSALIFKLRVWVHLDNMFIAETAIRFEIDRLFRERGITIAFPQRDIHIWQADEGESTPPDKS